MKSAISRNRFQFLLSKIYFNFLEKSENASKLYYVKELVNCTKDTFPKAMSKGSFQSINESMVKFKGCSALKQYLSLKPIKRGVKIWERCDSRSDYIYDFNIYARKTENDENLERTLGERVVNKLCTTIRNPDVVLSFDRFFASANLMTQLPFPAVKTVIKTRKNISKFVNKLKFYESEFLVTSSGIVVSLWLDSKAVVILCNCSEPNTTVVERKQRDGNKLDI